jgi:hypothetical protein
LRKHRFGPAYKAGPSFFARPTLHRGNFYKAPTFLHDPDVSARKSGGATPGAAPLQYHAPRMNLRPRVRYSRCDPARALLRDR